jgi:hypothetical protein
MKSRVAYAVWGMVLVGGLSAVLMVLSAGGTGPTALTTARTSSASPTARPSATATPSSQPTTSPPSATVTPTPTATPVATSPVATPTPSPTPPGQVNLSGTIGSIDQANNTFVLQRFTGNITITVTPSTQYTGTAANFGQLQPGWHANVIGQQSGGTVVATTVDANRDD